VPRRWLPKTPPYGHLRVTPIVNADAYRLRRTSLKTTGPTRLAAQGQIGPPCQGQLPAGVGGGRDGTRLTNNVELEPASALLRLIGPLAGLRVRPAVARNVAAEAGPGNAPRSRRSLVMFVIVQPSKHAAGFEALR
jgi:hypothetical protein